MENLRYVLIIVATDELVMDNSYCRGLLSMAKLYKLNQQTSQGLPLPETGPSPNPQLLDVNAKPRLGRTVKFN